MSTTACRIMPALIVALASPAVSADAGKSERKSFTGRHTRVVWVQDAGATACIYVEKPTVLLMGLDSDDGKGERRIVADANSFGD